MYSVSKIFGGRNFVNTGRPLHLDLWSGPSPAALPPKSLSMHSTCTGADPVQFVKFTTQIRVVIIRFRIVGSVNLTVGLGLVSLETLENMLTVVCRRNAFLLRCEAEFCRAL